MIYFFSKHSMFLTAGLLISQSILPMNISGDMTPIKTGSHEHCNTWSMAIPGDVSSSYDQDTQKNQNNNAHIIINSHLYSVKTGDNSLENSVSAAEFFHNLPITTLIAASMLGVTDLPLGIGCCKGFFLDSISKLSANKYVNYVELLRKFSQKVKQNNKSLLEFFDAYYSVEGQNIDFFELFTYMKVDYYRTMKIDNRAAFALSLDEFAFLSKLNKKYTVDLDGKKVCVERTAREVFDFMITHYKKELINRVKLISAVLGISAFSDHFLFKKQKPVELCALGVYLMVLALIDVRVKMILYSDFQQRPLIKTFQSNPH